MIQTIVNVVYVLVAIAMIALILMQRGAGAAAGSGFGGGASATVFGARGSANFLSQTTKWLAVVFFAMSLGMAWYAAKGGRPAAQDSSLRGSLMEGVQVPAKDADLPAVPADAAVDVEAAAPSEQPADAAEAEVPAEGDDKP